MKLKFLLLLITLIIGVHMRTFSQQKFPGGVLFPDIWYVANSEDLLNTTLLNLGNTNIVLSRCSFEKPEERLLNFNTVVGSKDFCITHRLPMENLKSYSAFVVTEEYQSEKITSRITSKWDPTLPISQIDSLTKNQFDFSRRKGQFNRKDVGYNLNDVSIDFVRWNMYETNAKYKSYGILGETQIKIGKNFTIGETEIANFEENFGEFISFPRELSDNEKLRVESYLALKYGVTLNRKKSYLSSKNITFWLSANNNIFGNRIFGIGRDDFSDLNQLQSESSHRKGVLITAVGQIEETNKQKQGSISIPNEHFLLYGDNNLDYESFGEILENGTQIIRRKWLAEATGAFIKTLPMCFRFRCSNEIVNQYNQDTTNLTIWLLKDPYANNSQISNFNSQFVEYFEFSGFNPANYANFYDVRFDKEESEYDQFTFGVGPKMIVQIRAEKVCNERRAPAEIVITGGVPPYHLTIQSNIEPTSTTVINTNSFSFAIHDGDVLSVGVESSNNLNANLTHEVQLYSLAVELGPSQILTLSEPSITLDASLGVTDPNATFEWFRNGVSLNHYEPQLTVTEEGDYSVTIRNFEGNCSVSDSVRIGSEIPTFIYYRSSNCITGLDAIEIDLKGGTAPFTATLVGEKFTEKKSTTNNVISFTDLEPGTYEIICYDQKGQEFREKIVLANKKRKLHSDLVLQLKSKCNVIEEAAALFEYPKNPITVSFPAFSAEETKQFKWYLNDVLISESSTLTIDESLFANDTNNQKLTASFYDTELACTSSQDIWFSKGADTLEDVTTAEIKSSEDLQSNSEFLSAKVYPNPTTAGSTFTYEITGTSTFSGTVELFTLNGVLLKSAKVYGQSKYQLPFELYTSGVYLITFRTSDKEITNKIIVK